MRLAQRASTKTADNIFMTSLIDHGFLQGHDGSIHPMDKTPVGKRLMLAAMEHVRCLKFGLREVVLVVGSSALLLFILF